MKLLLVFCLIAAAASAPASPSGYAQVVRYDNDNIGTGIYNYVFEQDDGIKAEATGELQNGGSEDAFVSVRGSFEWVGEDGVTYTASYVADENGYRPQYSQGQGGVIPEGVIKSLGNPAAATSAVYTQKQRSGIPAAVLRPLGR